MNKQYVQEQIRNAIETLREEYDAKLAAIYQCPDCGAVALRTSEHICFRGSSMVEPKKPKTVMEYILSVISNNPPEEELVDFGSIYTAHGIVSAAIASGCVSSRGSLTTTLSEMATHKKVNRRAATVKVAIKDGSKAKEVPGFVYWKSANVTV